MKGTQDTQASSNRSRATLRVLLTNPPQESSDDSATPDVSKIWGIYANVGASISLLDLEMEAATNVGASASLPLLVVEVGPNVGASTSLGLGQTTRITSGISVGHASASVASRVLQGHTRRT